MPGEGRAGLPPRHCKEIGVAQDKLAGGTVDLFDTFSPYSDRDWPRRSSGSITFFNKCPPLLVNFTP